MDFNVGQETKERASPIGARPGVCMVEPLVAGLWKSLMEIPDEFEPHAMSVEVAGADARDRFDVCRKTFFDPMMIVFDGWEAQMDHFVGQHPVIGKIGHRCVGADVNTNQTSITLSESFSTAHGVSGSRHDAEVKLRHREAAVIRN